MSYKLPPPPPGLPGSPSSRKSKTVAPPEWATNIPGRSPVFKIHENRGQAMNAVTYMRRAAQLLRLNQRKDGWEIVVDTTPLLKQPSCQWCGKGFTKSYGYFYGCTWHWEVPAAKLVVLCYQCDARGTPPVPDKLDEVVEQAAAEGAAATAASDAVLDEALKDEAVS